MKSIEYFKIYVINPSYLIQDIKLFFNRKYERIIKHIFNKLINIKINILKKYFNIYENPMSIISLILEKNYDNIIYMHFKGIYALYNKKGDRIDVRIFLGKPGQIIGVGGFKFDTFKKDCELIFNKSVNIELEEV